MTTVSITKCMMRSLSPKCFRATVLLIAIYKVLMAIAMLLAMLVGLVYLEQATNILQMSIAVLNAKPTKRKLKCIHILKSDEQGNTYDVWALAYTKNPDPIGIAAIYLLYTGTAMAIIYLVSCLGLLIGILRNRHLFFVPWLMIEVLASLGGVLLMLLVSCKDNSLEHVYKMEFVTCGVIVVLFHLFIWHVVRSYYAKLVLMTKLRENSTMATASNGPDTDTCPAGDGGLKQTLLNYTDSNEVV